jgi:hypothetical protein
MQVDLPALVAAYGYPVTFIGTLFEGETILTLAGLAAHRGHLAWLPLWLLAALGGTLATPRTSPSAAAMAPACSRAGRLSRRVLHACIS